MLEPPVCAVVLHLVHKIFRICGHVNDSYHLDLVSHKLLITHSLEDHATDAPEAIDADFDWSSGSGDRKSVV